MQNLEFNRYKQASLTQQTHAAHRLSLGTPSNPTAEHLAAIDQADVALELATVELSAARQDYLRDPGPVYQ